MLFSLLWLAQLSLASEGPHTDSRACLGSERLLQITTGFC